MDKQLQYVMTGDASGFVAATQQMASAMESLKRLLGEVSTGAATSAGSTSQMVSKAREHEQALRSQADAQRAFLQSLQQRAETAGMDPTQLLRYRAAQLGVSEQADVLVQRLNAVTAAATAKAAADAASAAKAREQEQAVRAQASAQQAFIQSLQQQVQTQGMSPDQLLRYRAAQLGVSEQADHLIGKLNATGKAGAASAAQISQGMRMLPMQMTDVVTSLASGMPLWMVMIQQGGQLKDSFGGIGPMFRGIGSAVMGIGPATLVIAGMFAAVAVGVTAFVAGQRESDALAVSIRNTGNAAGLTSTRYEELIKTTVAATGAATGMAREAAAAAVASGEFGGTSISAATQAITAYAKATGKTADEAAQNFKGIGRNAVQWAEDQNRSLHFLNIETYTHIRSLQEQGRAQEAASVAMQAMTRHLSEQPQHLGFIERAANAAGNAMSSFWDKAKGMGRAETVGDQIDEIASKLKRLDENKPQMGGWMGQRAQADWTRERSVLSERQAALQEQGRIEQRAASMKAEQAEKTTRAIEATKAIESQRDQTASPAKRREKELEEYRRHATALADVGKSISADQQRQDEQAIRDKYKDAKTAQPKAEKSRMGQFEESLAEERRVATERDAIHGMSQQQELAYWQRVASAEKMSAADKITVQRKIADTKTQILRTSAQEAQQITQIELQGAQAAKLAEVDATAEAARQRQQAGKLSMAELLQAEIGFEQQRAAIRKGALDQSKTGLDPTLDAGKLAQIAQQTQQVEQQSAARVGQIRGQLARETARVSEDIQMQQLKSWEDRELGKVAIEEEAARQAQARGDISKSALLQQEAVFEERRANIRRQALASQVDAMDPASDPVKFAQLTAQIEQLEMQHQVRMAQIRGQAATASAKETGAIWESVQGKMGGLWDQGINAMMSGTLTWKNAQRAVGAEVVRTFATEVIKPKVMAWLFGESAKTGATATGVVVRGTAEKAGALQSVALWAMTATKNILSSAWEAMAGAYKAIVGIPFVGPVLAPVAAGVAFAGVAALAGRVKSARGGYDIPSGVNPMTQLHEEEMVLPKQHANTVRALGDIAPRLLAPRGDPLAALHAPVTVAQAAPGGIATRASSGMAQSTPPGDTYHTPVTYNDHSGRLSGDEIRRNANAIGDIVNQQIKLNRIKG